MIDSDGFDSEWETMTEESSLPAVHEPHAFPAFQATYSLTILLNTEKVRQEYAVACGTAAPNIELPPINLPRVSIIMHDVVLESYDEASVMLPPDNRMGHMLFEQGGIISDAEGKSLWRVGNDIVYTKNEHTLVATLLSIFPCSIVH